jgi:hypothetical protein
MSETAGVQPASVNALDEALGFFPFEDRSFEERRPLCQRMGSFDFTSVGCDTQRFRTHAPKSCSLG